MSACDPRRQPDAVRAQAQAPARHARRGARGALRDPARRGQHRRARAPTSRSSSWGRMADDSLAAAEQLAAEGIDVEVIDPRTLSAARHRHRGRVGAQDQPGGRRPRGGALRRASAPRSRPRSRRRRSTTSTPRSGASARRSRRCRSRPALEQHYVPDAARIAAGVRDAGPPAARRLNRWRPMATEVPMPKLGLTMEEATIIEWLVADGSTVEADQPILLIETDKTETEVGSPGSGRLHQIGRPGDVFPCGERIALLLAEGEQPPASASTAPTTASTPAAAPGHRPLRPPQPELRRSAGGPGVAERPAGRRRARRPAVDGPRHRPGGRIVSEDVEVPLPPAPPTGAGESGRWRRSPPATWPTCSASISPRCRSIRSSSAITREGVAAHVRAAAPAAGIAAALVAGVRCVACRMPLLQEPTEVIRLSGMRGTIAKRMHASLQEMAQLTLTMDADMTAVLADRAERKALAGRTAAVDHRLRRRRHRTSTRDAPAPQRPGHRGGDRPAARASTSAWRSPSTTVCSCPVVRDAAQRDWPTSPPRRQRLADAARRGTLAPADLEGGTFSVSALGTFGVDMLHAGDQPAQRRDPRRRPAPRRRRRRRRRGRPRSSG